MVASRQVLFAAQILFILATVLAKISIPITSYWDLKLYPRDCFNEAPCFRYRPSTTLICRSRSASPSLRSSGFDLVVVFAGCIRIY
ncbi:hypothetical protein NEMBOFW57_009467 [Staphylotrichum longicolle]|uniref:Secreted protein n=1 Tax=Staphylotrichum longicolle TaxID=669026 RepID=A0AAD4HUT4_9PEZI|nr:hypothetical protein NEMBOFW57_009467 [Staphylotrichum longicolle]